MKNTFALLCTLILLFPFCKKEKKPSFSSDKAIITFSFARSANTNLLHDAVGVISADTITIGLPTGTIVTNLIPLITYSGAAVFPNSNVAQNFSSPIKYTVTAADGSSRSYIVQVHYQSNNKAITSFVFRAADNSTNLAADVNGIISGDTIRVQTGANTQNLVPTIVYSGTYINPNNLVAQNYSSPVSYIVTAEDGSTRNYTVIVSANTAVYAGSSDGYIYALDAMTGSLKWKYLTGGAVGATPTVFNGSVYVTSNDRYLYALDAGSGTLKWKTFVREVVDGCVVAANGLLYVTLSNTNSSTNPNIYAINAASGAIQFSLTSGNYFHGNPTVANGRLYVGDLAYGMYCFDATTGIQIWRYPAGIVRTNPAVVNGNIYFSAEASNLICLNATTGTLNWQFPYGNGGANPTVANNLVYYTYKDTLYAADAATGLRKWTAAVNNQSGYYDPVTANGVVYAGNGTGGLYALDALTGAERWRYLFINPSFNSGPIYTTVANGVVFTNSSSGKVYAINAGSGQLLWMYSTGGNRTSGTCITDYQNNIYHPSLSGEQQ